MHPVNKIAAKLFAQGITQDPLIIKRGHLLPALPILTADGEECGWFVPIVVDDRLVAFMQFNEKNEFSRFSTFMRTQGELNNCPLSASWLDSETIQRAANKKLRRDEHPGEPFLTYDNYPDRLVWAVPVVRGDKVRGVIYVAGGFVYTVNRADE